MKKSLYFILITISVLLFEIKAQNAVFIPNNDSLSIIASDGTVIETDTLKHITRSIKKDSIPQTNRYGWKMDMRSGERIFIELDSSLINFHQKSLVDGQSIAVSYLGNWGSPAQSKLFHEREESGLFPFLDVYNYYHKTSKDQIFLNTKAPYSNIYYQTGGGRLNKEERLNIQLSSNFGKKLNVGLDIDYVYSRGYYSYLSNKQVSYDFYTSYVSERYQLHAFAMNNYYNNSENGGISDDRYITDPNSLEGFNGSTDNILPNISRLWNRLKGRQIFISNRYNIGYNEGGDETEEDDDEEEKEFIPVASFILTTRYEDQQRRFASKDENITSQSYTETDKFLGFDPLTNKYNLYYLDNTANMQAKDQMAYWSFKNTFAISLNEGFKEWVKFGLTAFIEQDFRKFAIPLVVRTSEDGKPQMLPMATQTESQNSTVVGGMLTKQKGRYLRYNLKADLALLGAEIGEFRLNGDVGTTIKFAGKDASVKLTGYIKNLRPRYFQNNMRTKYTYWDKDLSDTRRVYVGGEINIPQTNTKLSGGVENIQNYIYYNNNKVIAQENKNLQVISVRADQNLKAGIFHWDNQIAYQMTSNKDVIPLPQLSLYSNVYLLAKLAKVLTIQLGVDAHFHTEYYAPGYDPSSLQFYNQNSTKVGGFPISTAYANLHLKRTRFFIMMYNVAKDVVDPKYFSTPHYPVNPMIMKMGISWNFDN